MNKIKTRKIFESIFEGEEETGKYLAQELHYTDSGDLELKKEYSEDGDTVAELRHTFADGNFIEQHNINSFEGIDQRTKFEYDGDLVIKMVDYYSAEEFIETIYTYDQNKRLVEVVKSDNDGESHGKVTYEYDDVERVTRETHHNSFDEESYELETTEDEHGNQIEIIERNFKGPDDYTEKIERHQFNEKGMLVNVEILFEENEVLILENIRNEKGLLVKQIKEDKVNNVLSESNYTINELGQRIKEEEFHDGEVFRTKEMSYDDKGEVIEEKSYTRVNEDFFRADRTTYEIEYYE